MLTSFDNRLVAQVEGDHQLGNNLQLTKLLNLVKVHGASVEDPAVHPAVGLVKPIAHESDYDVIRDYKTRGQLSEKVVLTLEAVLKVVGKISSELGVTLSSNGVLKELGHLNVDQLVLLSDS